MPKYAVEVGKLNLVSNEPISVETRERVLKKLRDIGVSIVYYEPDLQVVTVPTSTKENLGMTGQRRTN